MNARRSGPGRFRMSAALAGRAALERADQLAARVSPVRRGLLVFVFHALFATEAEADSGVMHPHERATIEGLKRLFDFFRDHGYQFVGADDIDRGLEAGGRYAHLTFDDGFASNLHLLDLLPVEEVHASVFPSVNHVREGTAFWWNFIYREGRRRGDQSGAVAEAERLRRMSAPEVNDYLLTEYGPEALRPVGDLDRPLTVGELRELGGSPWVEIGNHTLDHAVLTRCSTAQADAQITGAQQWLTEVMGEPAFVIAYPNGDCNETVAELARAQGLRLGVTVVPENNSLPLSPDARMQLGRFRIVFDHRERPRMRAVGSAVQLTAAARRHTLRRI